MADTNEQKIPKKLHYIWFGTGKKSDKMLHCMESWRIMCPDYEIIEWNENNFDLDKSPLIKTALAEKKWVLAADIARIFILYEHGGIYIDTDVEIIKSLDPFLKNEFFVGYDNKYWANSAIIGGVKGHKVLDTITKLYASEVSLTLSCLLTVHMLSTVLKKHYNLRKNGKTTFLPDGVAIYSRDYFYPIDYLTRKKRFTDNTHIIHHYTGTWATERQLSTLKFFQNTLGWLLNTPIIRPFEYIAARSYRARANKRLKKLDALTSNQTPNSTDIDA